MALVEKMGCGLSKPKRVLTADEYLAQARTGDVALFSSDGFDSRVVKCFTHSPYSHVGQVIVLDPIPKDIGGSGVYLWHSPAGAIRSLPDLLYDPPRAKSGPQLNDMRDALRVFRNIDAIDIRRFRIDRDSSHAWGAPSTPPDAPLLTYIRAKHRTHYESNIVELFKSAEDTFTSPNTEDTREYFCSELVAETFKQFGIMTTDVPSNEFTPRNFTQQEEYKLGLAPFVHFRTEARIITAR